MLKVKLSFSGLRIISRGSIFQLNACKCLNSGRNIVEGMRELVNLDRELDPRKRRSLPVYQAIYVFY
jgi:hypothetical protein